MSAKVPVIWKKILRALNNKVKKTHLFIIFIWLGSTVLAFAYFINGRLVDFDVDGKLNTIDNHQLAIALSSYTDALINHEKSTILHFSQPDCKCQQYSHDHIQDINKIASEHHFNIMNIRVKKDSVVPVTPSIAILDDQGDIVYFGPYGEGLACSQTSGYAQTVLHNLLKGYAANLIIKEAKGCYCKV
jgi:hypothetical protein